VKRNEIPRYTGQALISPGVASSAHREQRRRRRCRKKRSIPTRPMAGVYSPLPVADWRWNGGSGRGCNPPLGLHGPTSRRGHLERPEGRLPSNEVLLRRQMHRKQARPPAPQLAASGGRAQFSGRFGASGKTINDLSMDTITIEARELRRRSVHFLDSYDPAASAGGIRPRGLHECDRAPGQCRTGERHQHSGRTHVLCPSS
jgi:hypothetical protein